MKIVIADVIKVKLGCTGLERAPNPMIQRCKRHTERDEGHVNKNAGIEMMQPWYKEIDTS